jgi:2-amino-4-hydroxy-6-hydroxymethyldihydropteridine diphosphokinase
MPTTTYIGLGSNMGDRTGACRRALELLSRAGRVTAVSSLYCTEPVGYREQEEFINAVAEIETELPPRDLLAVCQAIENELGRVRLVRWGPRAVDLDILLYGNTVIKMPDLLIPHPQLSLRGFVLVPLCEIAPHVVHPVLKKTVAHLLHVLKDTHRVVKCGAA